MHQIYRSISAEWVCDLFSCSCLINQTIMFYTKYPLPRSEYQNYYYYLLLLTHICGGMTSVCLFRGAINVLRNGNKVSIVSNRSKKTKPKINHPWKLQLFMRAELKHRMDCCNTIPESKIGLEYLWSRED